jgi:hypothetical protein
MFPFILISPSASSSSDEPLVIDLIVTAGFLCMEGTPAATFTSLFFNLDVSFPERPDSTYKLNTK